MKKSQKGLIIILGIIALLVIGGYLFKKFTVTKLEIPAIVADRDIFLSAPVIAFPAHSILGVNKIMRGPYNVVEKYPYPYIPLSEKFRILSYVVVDNLIGIDQRYYRYLILADSQGEKYLVEVHGLDPTITPQIPLYYLNSAGEKEYFAVYYNYYGGPKSSPTEVATSSIPFYLISEYGK